MDLTLKPCTTSRNVQKLRCSGMDVVDRISSLPDELLIQILYLLKTKDAAAASVLSRRMRDVFSRITSLNFDDSSISYCSTHPHQIERLPEFKMFVDSVLQLLSSQQHLSRFRLRFGGDSDTYCGGMGISDYHDCGQYIQGCLPNFNPMHVDAWLCFPLTRNVRELELSIHFNNPGKLPSAVFTCETLEVLKLNTNLDLDQVSTMPSFRLPNLKVLHIHCTVLPRSGEFVTKLVSSCPLLEDFAVRMCLWEHADVIAISSPSLRRLDLLILRKGVPHGSSVLIDSPNLQYFMLNDALPCHYSVTNMNALVFACISIEDSPPFASVEVMLSLFRALSNVQHLCLCGYWFEVLHFDVVKDQLPVFNELKHLELDFVYQNWAEELLKFLKCSPFLETLEFPYGITHFLTTGSDNRLEKEVADLERWSWAETQAIPSCYGSHLKRIMIRFYKATERELELVKFLLRNASVLEELVISISQGIIAEQTSLESSLENLPRASIMCSIKVQ